MYKYLYPLIGVSIESLSQLILKLHSQTNNIYYLYIGVIGYAIAGLFFAKLLQHYNLGSSNILWHTLHFIILFAISVLYFKEKYSRNDIIGLIFGLLSLYFISNKHH